MATAAEALAKNSWHHIAGVREVTATGKTLKLYVDGVLAASAPDTTTGGLALATPDYIGREILCGPTTHPFKGLIDEPAVYSGRIEGSAGHAVHLEGGGGELSFGGTISNRPTGRTMSASPTPKGS
ncbi:MAG TPA: hypothetical protein DD490_01485 [Acidobacteria bacterium]|nr:hypothetical protein [Acidobacteriota bacterium]